MATVDPTAPKISDFVHSARNVCAFVETAAAVPLGERLERTRALLLAVYAAGARLPADVERTTSGQAPNIVCPADWPGFETCDPYWEVFDPYDAQTPVGASLSDDVLDVYADLRAGLWLWEQNALADAVWTWRYTFEIHWGAHAIDALRALHRACTRRMRDA